RRRRRPGSGNIGATNVLRTAGWLPGLVTLFGDVGKGWIGVALAGRIGGHEASAFAVGAVAAVVGNCWSIFLGFRGGKGGATGLGALLRLAAPPPPGPPPGFLGVGLPAPFGLARTPL